MYVGVRVTLSCPDCSYTSPTTVVCAAFNNDVVYTACGSTITVSLHPNTTWQQALSNCDIVNVTLTQ